MDEILETPEVVEDAVVATSKVGKVGKIAGAVLVLAGATFVLVKVIKKKICKKKALQIEATTEETSEEKDEVTQ